MFVSACSICSSLIARELSLFRNSTKPATAQSEVAIRATIAERRAKRNVSFMGSDGGALGRKELSSSQLWKIFRSPTPAGDHDDVLFRAVLLPAFFVGQMNATVFISVRSRTDSYRLEARLLHSGASFTRGQVYPGLPSGSWWTEAYSVPRPTGRGRSVRPATSARKGRTGKERNAVRGRGDRRLTGRNQELLFLVSCSSTNEWKGSSGPNAALPCPAWMFRLGPFSG